MFFRVKYFLFVSLFLGLAACSPTSGGSTKTQPAQAAFPVNNVAPNSDISSSLDMVRKVCIANNLDYQRMIQAALAMGGQGKTPKHLGRGVLEAQEIDMPQGLPKLRIQQKSKSANCEIWYATPNSAALTASLINKDPDFTEFPEPKPHKVLPKFRYQQTHIVVESRVGPFPAIVNGKVIPSAGSLAIFFVEKVDDHTLNRLLNGLLV